MGVDFIRERAQGFTRSWDRHRIDLSTRSLFTRDPRVFLARPSQPYRPVERSFLVPF